MVRRRASTGALLLCLLASVGLNQLALVGMEVLFTQSAPVPLPPGERITEFVLLPETPKDAVRPEETHPLEAEAEALTPRPMPKARPEPETPKPEAPEAEEPKPEEPKPEEPKPEEPKPVPRMELTLDAMKMVEQPEELADQAPPEHANYLSNIDRSVQEETRAKLTNLVEDAVKPEARQVESSTKPEPGTAQTSVIAQLEDQKGAETSPPPAAEKSVTPSPTPPLAPSPAPPTPAPPSSLLAMRNLAPREHQVPVAEHVPLANASDSGELAPQVAARSGQEAKTKAIASASSPPRYDLTEREYRNAFGRDTEARARLEASKRSMQEGTWEQRTAHWHSPLENFVPEVKVGNQTALSSRRHPFAQYIATVHRAIHERWSFGYLEHLDGRGPSHPLSDRDLWTRVEIVLLADGRIDRVITVRHSGKSEFDAAALESVYAAGPFPEAPPEIRSGNGKVYVHWAFHRDDRACGTFGAQPFILDNAGQGDRPDPNRAVSSRYAAESLSRERRLQSPRSGAPVAGPVGPAPPPASEGPSEGAAGVKSGPSGGAGGAHGGPSGGAGGAHGGPSGGAGGAHGGPSGGGPGRSSSSSGTTPPPPTGAPGGEAPSPANLDPKARGAATQWLARLGRGSVEDALRVTGVPFYSGDRLIAATKRDAKIILENLLHDMRDAGGASSDVEVHTAASLRRRFGSVPAGVQEGQKRLYALAKVGPDLVVLVLEQVFGTWKVVGLSR